MEKMVIQKKDLTVEPLRLSESFAWAQAGLCAEIERQYNLGLPVRIIVLKGRQVAHGVHAMVSPGSSTVRRQAEAEGLDRIFIDAGFEWHQSGCSMCLAMNDDVLKPGDRCASRRRHARGLA